MPKLKSQLAIVEFRGKYRFLSNFYPCDVSYEGQSYPSSEHAYQAAKTLNVLSRIRIGLLPTPGAAKREGQTLLLRPDWDRVKVRVMTDILRIKFAPGSDLAERLLATGGVELVEQNWWHDAFWGHCTCGNCPAGKNHLGRVLMTIRSELRDRDA